jgi:hypothetical protein
MASVLLFLVAAVPSASAQTTYVVASPGYVNLGMNTSIQVTAPSAGTYAVVVEQPNGTKANLDFTFTAAGEMVNATYGNLTSGFGASVNEVGTYDVYLEQSGQVVSSTSFYATNKLLVSMDMVNGGECAYIAGATRGTKMFPRFYISFESNGAQMTNTDPGAYVTYTLPGGTKANASWDSGAHLFVGKLQPNWNYTFVGPWNPTATIGDGAGNAATFQYTGSPYVISPVQLSTSIQVLDAATGRIVTTLSNGESVTIKATITYPTNAEPVKGFVGPLDSATRGGSVTAQLGWGYYNKTSGTFGGTNPGGLVGTISMTYTGSNGTWSGQFESSNLPVPKAGTSYQVVVSSKDDASPANTGFGEAILSLTNATTTTATQTAATETVTQTVQTIPTIVYASLAILLILGVIIGYIVRVPR